MPSKHPRLLSGVLTWVGAGLGTLAAYMLTIDYLIEWDWFLVIKGAVAHLTAGVGALALYFKGNKTAPDQGVVDRAWSPVHRDNRQLTQLKNWFGQHELECKGQTCDCVFPGMDPVVMSIANDVREKFGETIANSAYRCEEHNSSIPGASDDSYHKKAMAIDLRCLNATPAQVYAYLTAKYPSRFGFGLYKRFVHIDSRHDSWARKSSPDVPWQKFDFHI